MAATVVEAQSNVKCVLSTITLLLHVTTDSILNIRPSTIAIMALVIVPIGLKIKIRIGTTPLVWIGTQ